MYPKNPNFAIFFEYPGQPLFLCHRTGQFLDKLNFAFCTTCITLFKQPGLIIVAACLDGGEYKRYLTVVSVIFSSVFSFVAFLDPLAKVLTIALLVITLMELHRHQDLTRCLESLLHFVYYDCR